MSEPLTLLGSQSSFFTSPDDAKLESFPNRGTRPYTITLDTHEFSSLCPVTGQPDSCHLTITYVPDEKCVETKSLKYYLASYRNYPAFNEQIVNRITDDLAAAISPRSLKVEVDRKFRDYDTPEEGLRLSIPNDPGRLRRKWKITRHGRKSRGIL